MDDLKFALVAVAAAVALWFAVTRLIRFLSWVEKSEIARQAAESAARKKTPSGAAPAPVAAENTGIPAHHVAAIAAAVAACGYRVAHIADPRTGSAWAAEGRRLLQTSHQTH